MDLLALYSDDSGADPVEVNLAPDVEIKSKDKIYEKTSAKEVYYNPKYETLWKPVQGPVDPNSTSGLQAGLLYSKNAALGFVEQHNMNDFIFDDQYHTFYATKVGSDPMGPAVEIPSVYNHAKRKKKTQGERGEEEKELKRKQLDPADAEYMGPWAKKKEVFEGTEEERQENLAKKRKLDEEAQAYRESLQQKEKERKKKEEGDKEEKKKEGFEEATAILHVASTKDYQGRSFLAPPSSLKQRDHETFLPKKLIHTWAGHTKGVSAIKFFPKTAHLLLSASLDNDVKIWDVYNNRACIMTYKGHTSAVKDINFSNDGTHFLSTGYDRKIRYWDTETGKALGTFSNNRIGFCCRFYPENNNEFLIGCSDKKIIQWDIRDNKITQEYDSHLGAVNTITFIDENRRFVTSSDDKSLRVWEYNIPVVIKYISEPHMHSMPSICVHPNESWLLTQSLDNQILVYSTKDRFKLNKKKRFTGHLVAGTSAQVNTSPDGNYVISGDLNGMLHIWNWKSSKLYKSIQAHDGVCVGCEWHPIEPSRIATCGWDGTIKYWD